MEQLWVLDAPSKSVAKRIVVQAGLREATDAEILAAAANLDGAREVYTDWATRVRTVDREVTAVIKPGRYLVIPLPDKETLSCGCMSEGATCENALPDKETPNG